MCPSESERREGGEVCGSAGGESRPSLPPVDIPHGLLCSELGAIRASSGSDSVQPFVLVLYLVLYPCSVLVCSHNPPQIFTMIAPFSEAAVEGKSVFWWQQLLGPACCLSFQPPSLGCATVKQRLQLRGPSDCEEDSLGTEQ